MVDTAQGGNHLKTSSFGKTSTAGADPYFSIVSQYIESDKYIQPSIFNGINGIIHFFVNEDESEWNLKISSNSSETRLHKGKGASQVYLYDRTVRS